MTGANTPVKILSRSLQHIFDKDAIAGIGLINQNMSHCTNNLPVLNNR